jgi:hypothetical protein
LFLVSVVVAAAGVGARLQGVLSRWFPGIAAGAAVVVAEVVAAATQRNASE